MTDYTIYKITHKHIILYVGMTSNSLRKRLFQHITDAKRNTCSVSNKLCQKEKPPDLKRLHDYIKSMNDPNQLSITTLEKFTGTYHQAKTSELKLKKKYNIQI